MEKAVEIAILVLVPLFIYAIITFYFSKRGTVTPNLIRWLLALAMLIGLIYSPSCLCIDLSSVIFGTISLATILSVVIVLVGFTILKLKNIYKKQFIDQ